ncbi:MAG: hypothetical protein A3I24_02185 [Candidatus Harrisonbacteria bacterium RIFCSPLOWO2_02_FULL_41_13b]|uniref:AB hydrolase-1 domain-containing protein n=1 Tax=Candidatus Harrisonbacteria bacterium RIFCSPLOWO2_02_FULL_41_13b TaxID=1798409 RepID=A0A1G1ZWG7_9BACT|nr:MAG: hypothetical protein A3J53_03545 [Candidatus Harrisonbacteria bacterium RIFCSPHIGHO2_02_FULL_40_20]OGY68217.1 MAG: hypothetical protein A3I24_02185 [Candidatus Harrisonbacteria bacterium RIFCSPLOWO2_02_FULL_41_13b]
MGKGYAMAGIHKITDPQIVGENQNITVYEPARLLYSNPILAIHGMWGQGERWTKFARFFSEQGYRFIAPTLRHHYPENKIPALGKTSVNDYINDLMRLILALQERGLTTLEDGEPLAKPIIFGHSMGGLIAQKLASFGLAHKLILLNSAPPAGVKLHANLRYQLDILRYLPWLILQKPFKPNLKIFARYVMNNVPPETWDKLYRGLVYESGRAALEIRLGRIQVDFRKISCPSLVIGCEKDQITPPEVARDIGKQFRHIGYEVWTYPQFAHWIPVESGWEEAAGDIFHWLNIPAKDFEYLKNFKK